MPEPLLVAIAVALAGKGTGSLYDLVKRKFSSRRESVAVLAAAEGKAAESREVAALGEELAAAEQADPEFSSALRALWEEIKLTQQADRGGVVNQISGNVTGKVVQARDIEGGVSF